jgi:hypothetical protein
MKIFTLASFWALLAAIACYFLQLSPMPGIFLVFMGGPFLTGLLIDIFFVALLVEALTGRIPRVLAIVPLLAAGAYYAVFLQQGIAIQARNDVAKAANPRPGSVAFDPSRMSLVDDDALVIVRRYAVPKAYKPASSQPEGYFVNLIVPRPQCDAIPRDSQVRVRKSYGAGAGMGRYFRTICDLSFPERPTGPVLSVTHSGDISGRGTRDGQESQAITEFRLDGVLKARFTTIRTSRLASFPLFLAGCTLVDSTSSWMCLTGFHKTPVTLGADSFTGDRTAPERVVLGLRDYTDQELDNFQGYSENAKRIAAAKGVAGEVQKEALTTLAQALADETKPLPSNMGYSIAKEPQELSAHAGAMADRFNNFIRQNAALVTKCAGQVKPGVSTDQLIGRREWKHAVENTSRSGLFWDCWKADQPPATREALLSTLAVGLAALPPEDFAPLAPRLLETLHQPAVNGDYLPNRLPVMPTPRRSHR